MVSQKTLFEDQSVAIVDKSQKTKRLLIMDGGERQNYVKVWDSASNCQHTVTFDEFLNIPSRQSFADISFKEHDEIHVLGELAHFVLANDFSLAQIFSEQQTTELINIINSKRKFIFSVWSEKMTTAALRLIKGTKDIDDTRAICNWIQERNYYDTLKKIKTIEDLKTNSKIVTGNNWRQEVTNRDINKAQKVNYGLPKKNGVYLDLNLCPVMRDIILPNWKYIENLSPELKQLFKIDDWKEMYNKKTGRTLANFPNAHPEIKEFRHLIRVVIRSRDNPSLGIKKGDIDLVDWIPEMRGLYYVFNGLFDYNGELREHPINKGFVVSNNWLHDHYMVDKQHHQKGGVGRAIKYHYVFPPYVADKWEEIHGKKSWPRTTESYTSINSKGKKENKRHNRGSLTKEQDRFFLFHRNDIRKRERDEITIPFREKYLKHSPLNY